MVIGDLRARVTIKVIGNSTDAGGGVSKSVSSSWEQWAKVEDRTGQVQFNNGQQQVSYDYKVTIRYYASKTVSTGNVITYNGKDMMINSVQRVNENNLNWLVLRCSAYGGN
jgi:SPP1 family predicted phage head-tail adaptor